MTGSVCKFLIHLNKLNYTKMEILLIIAALFIYFLPAIIGGSKNNAGSIFALNLFLGWTLIGWVVSLVWACTKDAPKQVTTVTTTTNSYQAKCENCSLIMTVRSHYCPRCFKDNEGYTAEQNIERFK